MERRSAAEQKSGIGGKMVRTKETNAADPDEQKATQETAREEVSQAETNTEQDLPNNLRAVVLTMLEIALLGSVNFSREWMGFSEKARHVRGSEKEMPGISLADSWMAEPEWRGESREAEAEMGAGSREPEQ
jgi:hypothetical protein